MKDPAKSRTGYLMRAKQCRPCRGTGIGRFVNGASVACIHCLGYGQILYAERVSEKVAL